MNRQGKGGHSPDSGGEGGVVLLSSDRHIEMILIAHRVVAGMGT